jgi:hypothetical protein
MGDFLTALFVFATVGLLKLEAPFKASNASEAVAGMIRFRIAQFRVSAVARNEKRLHLCRA